MSECTSLKKGQGAGSGANKAGNWKVLHDGNTRECVDICPPGYMDDYDNPNRCKRCEGRCPRGDSCSAVRSFCKSCLISSPAFTRDTALFVWQVVVCGVKHMLNVACFLLQSASI